MFTFIKKKLELRKKQKEERAFKDSVKKLSRKIENAGKTELEIIFDQLIKETVGKNGKLRIQLNEFIDIIKKNEDKNYTTGLYQGISQGEPRARDWSTSKTSASTT